MRRLLRLSAACVSTLGLSIAIGCSAGSSGKPGASTSGAQGASSATGSSGNGGGNSSGAANGGSASTLTGAGPTTVSSSTGLVLNLPDAGPDAPVGNGMPEICDGIDNNDDGIIDNVDANGDGICDCLLIATLGRSGTWGQGDVFQAWLGARSNNGVTDLADQTLTADLLKQFEVIVVQDVDSSPHKGGSNVDVVPIHAYSAAEVQAVQDWVNAGGGLMTLTGYADAMEVANSNLLLAPFSMSYDTPAILPKMGGSTVPITMWTAHPIDTGVTAVGVDSGHAVLGGTVIATGGGNNVGNAQEVGLGHVFVWGDEWITYNSEWQSHPDYQVELFWVNAIKWLTAVDRCQVPIPPILPQ